MSADSGHVVRNFNALQTAAFFKGAAFDFCQSIGQVYFFQTGTVIKSLSAKIRQMLRQPYAFQTSTVFKCLSSDFRKVFPRRPTTFSP